MIRTVTKHRYFNGAKATRSVRRYVNYLAHREGEDKPKGGRLFFNEEADELQSKEVKSTIGVTPSRYAVAHELVLSPGMQTVDEKRYARELMERLGKSKGLDLNWAGTVHKGKHNHVHVVIDGSDKNGRRVHFAKEEYRRLREWGDQYLDREHCLERHLTREVDVDNFERDVGDKPIERLLDDSEHLQTQSNIESEQQKKSTQTTQSNNEENDMTATTTPHNQIFEDEERAKKERKELDEKLEAEKKEEDERLVESQKEEDERLEKLRFEEDERLAQMKQEEEDWRRLEQKEERARQDELLMEEERRLNDERIYQERLDEDDVRRNEDLEEDEARRQQERLIDGERRAREYKIEQMTQAKQLFKDSARNTNGLGKTEDRSPLSLDKRPRLQRLHEDRGRNLEWHIRRLSSEARMRLHQHMGEDPEKTAEYKLQDDEIKHHEREQLESEIQPIDLDEVIARLDEEAASRKASEKDDISKLGSGVIVDEHLDPDASVVDDKNSTDLTNREDRDWGDIDSTRTEFEQQLKDHAAKLYSNYVDYSLELQATNDLEFTESDREKLQELKEEKANLQVAPDGESEAERQTRRMKLLEIEIEGLKLAELEEQTLERESAQLIDQRDIEADYHDELRLEAEYMDELFERVHSGRELSAEDLDKMELSFESFEDALEEELTKTAHQGHSGESDDSDSEVDGSGENVDKEIELDPFSEDRDEWEWLEDDPQHEHSDHKGLDELLGPDESDRNSHDKEFDHTHSDELSDEQTSEDERSEEQQQDGREQPSQSRSDDDDRER